MPDGYYTDEGRRDLKRFVAEATKDWEAHSQRLAAAREAARRGREPLSLQASFSLACLALTMQPVHAWLVSISLADCKLCTCVVM